MCKYLIILSVSLMLMLFQFRVALGAETQIMGFNLIQEEQKELTIEELVNRIVIVYEIPRYCRTFNLPLSFYNYINAFEVRRMNSDISLYITQVENGIYCFQILKYRGLNNYQIIDERYYKFEEISNLFMKQILQNLIVLTNPARNLEK